MPFKRRRFTLEIYRHRQHPPHICGQLGRAERHLNMEIALLWSLVNDVDWLRTSLWTLKLCTFEYICVIYFVDPTAIEEAPVSYGELLSSTHFQSLR